MTNEHLDHASSVPSAALSTVERPRLLDRLDAPARITIVNGVPGSGRTTLVASWARSLRDEGTRVLWVAGSSRFSDRATLWAYLLGSIDHSAPIAQAAPPVLCADSLAEQLAAALRASESPVTVVLDDAGLYFGQAHAAALASLVSRAGATRFVLIGHVLPPFPVGTQAVRIKSWELHAAAGELAEIVVAHGIRVPPAMMDAVSESFRGWLAPSLNALHTMAESLALGRAPEYACAVAMENTVLLVREIFTTAAAIEVLKPLWQWQLAHELTADTARIALDTEHPHAFIARLEDEGAVVSVPEAYPLTWRSNLTPTLADALIREYDGLFADVARRTHGRLAAWHSANGEPVRAVGHAVRAEDWDGTTRLITSHWSSLLSTSKDTLDMALNAMPQSYLDQHPRWIEAKNYVNYIPSAGNTRPVRFRHTVREPSDNLMDVLATLTSRSASMRFSGQFDEAARIIAEIDDAIGKADPEQLAAVSHVLPELRLQWGISLLLAGDGPAALPVFEITYDEALHNDNPRVAVDAAGNLALMLALAGSVDTTIGWLGKQPVYENTSGPASVHTAGNMARVILALDDLDLDAARSIIATTLDSRRAPEQWAIHEALRGQLAALESDARVGLATLHTALAERSEQQWEGGINRALMLVAQADLLIASGRPATAQALLNTGGEAEREIMHEYVETARARAALFAGDLDAAEAIAAHHIARDSASARTVAEMMLVLAVTALHTDRKEEAAGRFRSALEAVQNHSLAIALARAPRSSLHELRALPGCALPDRMLAAIERTNAVEAAMIRRAPLSPRERDVLRHLVDGISVNEIARVQFVTRNTVKTQLRSIYKKLGTSSREETVRLAQGIPGL